MVYQIFKNLRKNMLNYQVSEFKEALCNAFNSSPFVSVIDTEAIRQKYKESFESSKRQISCTFDELDRIHTKLGPALLSRFIRLYFIMN